MQPSFIAQLHPAAARAHMALWFIFQKERILLKHTLDGFVLPNEQDIGMLHLAMTQKHYLGLYGEIPCFIAQIQGEAKEPLPQNMAFHSIRDMHPLLNNDDTLFHIVTRAKQILHWDSDTQFCGHCGQKTQMSELERAKVCSACNRLFFPQISPVMLALIYHADQILLARSAHFLPGIYSILAGFVEPGETLEQAVVREVKEEVGIAIKNLRYFGSQPWPFISNLMLGFTAEYDHGTIQIDPKEIEDAQWFSIKDLPPLPSPVSLSRRMIEHHLRQHKK